MASRAKPKQSQTEPLGALGRYAGPATLILSSLAGGSKHGYALTKDIEAFAGVRLAPGTLYEALSRLEGQGLIEAVESHDRRRPYRLTATGAVRSGLIWIPSARWQTWGYAGWRVAGAWHERSARDFGAAGRPLAPLVSQGLAVPLR